MAENKKAFILYTDLVNVVRKLVWKDRENKTNYGGELFLHILEYVSDTNPIPIDFIIEMAFEPIKLQLKRDLEKYEVTRSKRSKAGLISAELRKQTSTNSTHVESVQQTSTNSTVIDTDIVKDKVKDINKKVDSVTIEIRKKNFSATLSPFLEKYGKEMLNKFYLYWTEESTNKKKMRFESEKFWTLSKRLSTWHSKELTLFQKPGENSEGYKPAPPPETIKYPKNNQ